MGILEDLLASTMSGQGGMGGQGGLGGQPGMGGRARQAPAQASGGGMGGVMMALLPVVLAMLAQRGGGSGGMGDLLGQILGGGAQGGAGMGGMGGLGSLLEGFQRAGFGEQAGSWVGTGQNLPIPPEAIEQIFGRDGLSQIAAQAGVSEADASAGLSQLLPEVVDRVTPNGQMPDLDALTASVSDLSRRFGLA
jgi:uncharacterized protein YidB (DUF937 family)